MFNVILSSICHKLERETFSEDQSPPEFWLAICFYRLGRGNYFYSIAEMAGLVQSMVSIIAKEVCEAIVTCLWKEHDESHMPKMGAIFREKIFDMEEMW